MTTAEISKMNAELAKLRKQLDLIETSRQLADLEHRLNVFAGLEEPNPEPTFDAEKFRKQQRVSNFTAEKLEMFTKINEKIELIKANKQPEKLTRNEIAQEIEKLELAKLQIGNAFSTAESYLGDFYENHYVELFRGRARRIFNEAMKTDAERTTQIWAGETNQQIADWNILQNRAKNL